ncbi:MAG: pyridoxamine 5'-phosphate oxidase family protein [Anaerolineales bacterium]|nr:pyridoxamine 5'-phosphate oxidase family protein [Anaerolineales bacterium]
MKEKTNNYTKKPYTTLRRSDREVTDEAWIKAFLTRSAYGTLATSVDDQPFLNAGNYVYDESQNTIYFHRARKGRTSENLAANNRVCYMVSEMGRVLIGESAGDFGVEYSSVIVFGRVELVEEEAEKSRALQMLVDKYAPHLKVGEDYEPVSAHDLKRVAVYKIEIEEWSGKRRQAAPEHPGYTYPHFPEES